MRFHLPSFLIGYAAGASTVLVGRHLRPVLVEAASVFYQFADAVAARLAVVQEDLEDALAEGRARARAPRSRPRARRASATA